MTSGNLTQIAFEFLKKEKKRKRTVLVLIPETSNGAAGFKHLRI